MELKDFYRSEPQKYWTPPKNKNIESDILTNPEKYSSYIGMYKMDGNWSRVIIDENNNVTIQSRTISKVTGNYSEKTEHVPHLVKLFQSLNMPKTVILGELCYWDLHKTTIEVGKILRCLPKKAVERQKDDPLCFYAFDCLMFCNRDITGKTFTQRYSYLQQIAAHIKSELFTIAPTFEVTKVAEMYDDYLEKSGEGFLLMRKDATYDPGTRTSWKSIKLKKATKEMILPVVDTIDPVKEYNGANEEEWKYYRDGRPVTRPYYYGWKNGVVVDHDGVKVLVTSGLNDKVRELLAQEETQQKIKEGKYKAKISGMEVTKDNSIRHPVFLELIEL